jgi:hypothetical protein
LPKLWILPEMPSLSAHHYFLSAVAVFIGGAKIIPGWNYPLYGSLTDACTIRRYWGYVSTKWYSSCPSLDISC